MQHSKSFADQLKTSAHDGYLSGREGVAKATFWLSFTPAYFVGWVSGKLFGK